MSNRPKRIRIVSELGKPQTLADGGEQFISFGRGERIVILGLGPEPAEIADLLPAHGVSFVESPDFEAQMPDQWSAAVPRTWTRLEPDEITPDLARASRFVQYRPIMRLFPGFWGPLLARIQWALLSDRLPAAKDRPEAWLPAKPSSLLVPELTAGLETCGFDVRIVPPEVLPRDLPRLLAESRPDLFLSVNFLGLDPLGESFHLLRAAGAEVAAWCVDNPFHLLSGIRAGWWREAALLVTDDSFIPLLREHGAERLLHMPLAAWSEHFSAASDARAGQDQGVSGRLVFVGRSQFPKKKGFFAGLDLPDGLWREARELLERGERPDFLWWRARLGIDSMWPESHVRRAGLGADEATRELRGRCLRVAAREVPLSVFGDALWREAAPEVTDLRPEVDYYGPLRDIYAQAQACLNVTSLLLPAGLTQRHFDVWSAGGALITDATPGLAIFPEELCREVRFRWPEEIGHIFRRLTRDTALRADLIHAWREHILAGHTYRHRVERLLNWLELHNAPKGIDLSGQGG